MKILCLSDHIDPFLYTPRVKRRFKDIDMILGCGDLRLGYYDFLVTNLNKPLFFVFGNHHIRYLEVYKNKNLGNLYYYETKQVKFQSVGGTYIDEKCVKSRGLLIMGFDGCMWYNGEPNQFTDFGMALKVIKKIPRLLWNKLVHKKYLDILISHAPPYKIHDQEDPCHRGFKIFRWFLKVFKPKYHIHGHIHLYSSNKKKGSEDPDRLMKFCETTVINAYEHFVLEI